MTGVAAKGGPGLNVALIDADRVKAMLTKYGPECVAKIVTALKYGAVAIQNEARSLIQDRSGKEGRWYYNSNKRPSKHQASEPGQAPANWTGKLMRGITVLSDPDHVVFYIVSRARADDGTDYGAALELGTKDGRIEKRPFLRPSYLKVKPTLQSTIKQAIKSAKNR